MAYSYKGAISFGLVYIPISLQMIAKDKGISFNQIDKKTMSRVKYIKTCVDCDDRVVKNEDIVKGYQYEKDKYVIIDEEEFEELKTEKEKSIVIEKFVELSEIDPMYFEKTYQVIPESGAMKSYSLLATAMNEQNKAGIAKTVLGNKETIIVLRMREDKMLMSTLFFIDEIQPSVEVSIQEVDGKELEMATQILNYMSGEFNLADYKDEYKEKLQKLIQSKIDGQEFVVSDDKIPYTENIMDALKKMLEEQGKKATVKSKKSVSTKSKMKKPRRKVVNG